MGWGEEAGALIALPVNMLWVSSLVSFAFALLSLPFDLAKGYGQKGWGGGLSHLLAPQPLPFKVGVAERDPHLTFE